MRTIAGFFLLRSPHRQPTGQIDMEFPTSLSAALLAVLLYAALLRRWRRSASKALPGPAGLPLVGSLPFLDPDLHTYFARLAAAHGPIFSIQLGAKRGVVISSPALAREVLKDQDAVFANRDVPAVARVIAYGGADIVWNPNGPTWRMLRRVCVREMLAPASLDAVYGLRRQEVRSTVHHLYSHAGAPVDVGAQLFLTVMNVITSMLWGGTMEGEERSAVGKEFRELVAEITELLGRRGRGQGFLGLHAWVGEGRRRCQDALHHRLSRSNRSMQASHVTVNLDKSFVDIHFIISFANIWKGRLVLRIGLFFSLFFKTAQNTKQGYKTSLARQGNPEE